MLHCEVHGLANGSRVTLVHGFTQTSRSWGEIAEVLASSHEVVTVDAPGHGRSSAIRADMVHGAELLAEVGGEASYLGYSMGGRLALHLALARPQVVRRLVLVGATAGLDDDGERRRRRRSDEALAADLERDGLEAFLARWLANPLFATLSPAAAGVEMRRENTVEGLASSLRLMGTGAQAPLWDRLVELQMPVLFVVGSLDAKFRTLADRMAARWGGPAEVHVVDGAGHAAHLERPQAFLDAVVPFLADQPAATPAARSSP